MPEGTPPPPRNESDAPEISRSVGEAGGVVLLWPRIVPRDARESMRVVATDVQAKLRALIQQAAPSRAIDERPEPERVCPRSGCVAPSVSALLVRSGDGCALLLMTSAPGTTPTRLVPWIAEATLDQTMVPFRDPPEASVHVRDFARCEGLSGQLGMREAEILAALQELLSGD